eukprot:UN05357
MPIICLGPVCVPITALVPILLFIFKPIYVRLPKEYQEKIDYAIKQSQLALNRCLRKIGWLKSKKKKTETPPNNTDDDKHFHEQVKDKDNDTLIKEMEDENEWDALMERSKTQNLSFIAYFTSPWCKSCKTFYPIFEDLCSKSQSNLKFIKVDIDEFDEVALEYKVSVLPTFMKFTNGAPCGFVTGPNKDQLQDLLLR